MQSKNSNQIESDQNQNETEEYFFFMYKTVSILSDSIWFEFLTLPEFKKKVFSILDFYNFQRKEHDRSALLDQYREATNELSKMKMTLNQFETELSNLRIELQMKHAENKRLRERIDSVEKDNQQVWSSMRVSGAAYWKTSLTISKILLYHTVMSRFKPPMLSLHENAKKVVPDTIINRYLPMVLM